MNYETVTVQDCIDAYELRGWRVILIAGQVIDFEGRQ